MKYLRQLRRDLRHVSAMFHVSCACVRLARFQAYLLNGRMGFAAEVVVRQKGTCLLRVENLTGDRCMAIIVDGPFNMVDGTVLLKYHPVADLRMITYFGRVDYLRKPEAYLTAAG